METDDTDTSSYLPPSALKLRLQWDVFLSFKQADKSDAFAGRLYEALQNDGVRVFIGGDDLTRGSDLITPSHVEAIEDSAAGIAIISSKYADSRCCLEELSKLFESKRLVLPVFYQVDPSNVRRQRGSFEEAFDKLEVEGDGNVTQWRKALEKAGNLSGYVVGEREESVVQLIVRRIRNVLSNNPVHVATHVVGLDSRVETVLTKLDVKSPGFRVLGIHGTPGVGKTTIAKAAFNKLIGHFKQRCFVSNANETWKKDGLSGVQRRVLFHLQGSTGNKADAEVSTSFQKVIHENPVLVVLDDVADAGLLDSLGIKRRKIDEGSRIIITSRDKDLLLGFACDELYEPAVLEFSESLELFSYHSLRRKEPTQEFFDLAAEIVRLTGGLPLALEVFGSSLLDKRSKREWEEALQKLQIYRPPRLHDVLKLSYDGLDEKLQEIFLDISCLFIQMEMTREDAIEIVEACDYNAETAIDNLIKKSLLKITSDNTLWMHDQIKDMGRQIVMDKDIHPGNHSRLWDTNDIVTVLKDKQGTNEVRGIVLSNRKELVKDLTAETIAWRNFQREPNVSTATTYLREKLKEHFRHSTHRDDPMILSTESFEPMAELKLLQINYVNLEGDFKYMPAKLRWLEWKGCALKSLPQNIPQDIRVLNLSESKIECLWGWRWWPLAWKKVADNLTVMNLRGCCNLTAVPDLSGHKKLKKLILERCMGLTEIHKSIGNMSSLVHLNLKDCSNIVEFPADISGLTCLEELILSGCSRLKEFPDDVRSLQSLVQLLADGTAISKLPGYLFHLTKLEVLNLNHCQRLKCLPGSIGNPTSLKELSLAGSALENLPCCIGSLENLEKLDLARCSSLTSLPESFGNLKSLMELFLNGTPIDQLPDFVCSLPCLKTLSVNNCRNLCTLPATIGRLSSIVELQLDKTSISELPDQIDSLKYIKKLEMRNCSCLKSFPESIGSLLTLSTLVMVGAAITELPDSICKLENLVSLNLNGCKQLCVLPDEMGQLKSLHRLLMEETAVTELPESFGMLSNLRTLRMSKKPHLLAIESNGVVSSKQVVLPTSFSNLSLLIEFHARASKISGEIPDDFANLSLLKILDLGYNSFHSLPSSLENLCVLEKLSVSHCTELKSLPPLPSSLLELNAADCYALTRISGLSNLERLQEFQLSNCGKLKDVPGVECLKSLRRLYMGGCSTACASNVTKGLSKVRLKKLLYLCIPGSEIPGWFSQRAVKFSTHVNLAIKGMIVGLVVSVNHELLGAVSGQVPAIVDIHAKIVRLNLSVFTTAMYLLGVPRTPEDQMYLCLFRDYHPLVSMLKDGDKIEVTLRSEDVTGIELKRYGILLVYENDDDYDGDEDLLDENQHSVSAKLARFLKLCGE